MDGITDAKEVILFAAIKGICQNHGYKSVRITRNNEPIWTMNGESIMRVFYTIVVKPPIRTHPHHQARKDKEPPRIPLRDKLPKSFPDMHFSSFIDGKHTQAIVMSSTPRGGTFYGSR